LQIIGASIAVNERMLKAMTEESTPGRYIWPANADREARSKD